MKNSLESSEFRGGDAIVLPIFSNCPNPLEDVLDICSNNYSPDAASVSREDGGSPDLTLQQVRHIWEAAQVDERTDVQGHQTLGAAALDQGLVQLEVSLVAVSAG